jgi:hypothetical protein
MRVRPKICKQRNETRDRFRRKECTVLRDHGNTLAWLPVNIPEAHLGLDRGKVHESESLAARYGHHHSASLEVCIA